MVKSFCDVEKERVKEKHKNEVEVLCSSTLIKSLTSSLGNFFLSSFSLSKKLRLTPIAGVGSTATTRSRFDEEDDEEEMEEHRPMRRPTCSSGEGKEKRLEEVEQSKQASDRDQTSLSFSPSFFLCSLTCFLSPAATSASKWACTSSSAVRESTMFWGVTEKRRERAKKVRNCDGLNFCFLLHSFLSESLSFSIDLAVFSPRASSEAYFRLRSRLCVTTTKQARHLHRRCCIPGRG